MKAVILAGGQDVQRCPLRMVRPRPVFPLLTDVLLRHLLRILHSVDVDEAVVCANGKTHILREHFLGDHAEHVSLEFYDDELPRGPAGCVRDAADSLGDGPLLVFEAGLFLDGDIGQLIEDHRRNGSALTVGAVPARDWNRGDGSASADGPLSPLGVYVVEPDVLEHIPERGYYDIKEQLIPKLRQAHLDVSAARYRGRHRRILDAHSYATLVQELLAGVFGREQFASLTEVAPDVWASDSTLIEKPATLLGPVVIGPNAVVGEDAVVAGPALIGEGVVIEEKAFVSNSILWPHAIIGFGARVEHSIVTDLFRVRPLAHLSRCVAIDRELNLGDVHGLKLGGYGLGVPA